MRRDHRGECEKATAIGEPVEVGAGRVEREEGAAEDAERAGGQGRQPADPPNRDPAVGRLREVARRADRKGPRSCGRAAARRPGLADRRCRRAGAG